MTRSQLFDQVAAELGHRFDAIAQVLRVTLFVQATPDFTQHSEVADAASDTLHRILGEAVVHTRSSVGVVRLPKSAAVELDMMAPARDGEYGQNGLNRPYQGRNQLSI